MAVLARKARDRLEAVVTTVRTGPVPDLRTKLDEWKAFEVGGLLVGPAPRLRQRWLNNPCPWVHHERLLKHMDWITPAAAEVLRRGQARDPAVRKKGSVSSSPYRLIVEHAVPVRALHRLLREDERLWEARSLRIFLLAHYRRGLLIKYGEDSLLDAAGLKQAMPPGWTVGQDPFARYVAVGLTRA